MASRNTDSKTIEDRKKKAYQKAEKKAEQRAREKAQRKAIEEEKKRRYQKVLRFDADGNRIGDDGYPMTKARWRLHYLYNGVFIYMIVVFIAAVVMIAASFFQGQQLTPWELVAYGGNQFHGYSTGSLLRIEALYLLFLTALCLFTNIKGMAWLYDGAPIKPVRITTGALGISSICYFFIECSVVKVFDPFSLIASIGAVLMVLFVRAVDQERPNLRKAKVASTVVKN